MGILEGEIASGVYIGGVVAVEDLDYNFTIFKITCLLKP